jgi:DNA polymerase-3 subunit epsilon/ATP-dependent DNA helicase DinG
MSRIYVALDLETTGLNPERDAITEIGVVKFRDEQVLDTWSSLVNPQRPIPYRVQQLTGITQEEVDAAPSLSSVIGTLLSFVKDCPIVGHSVSFDLGFLNRQGIFLSNQTIDTFELASILLPHVARYSLGKLAEALNIRFPTRHRALEDALATKDLFLALVEQASKLDLSVIQEINRLATRVEWPLRQVFQDLERTKARSAFVGSIGQQLLAKGALDGEGSLSLLTREDERPLQPSPERRSLDVDGLAAMLEEGGIFAQDFAGYEYRSQQVEMLRAVAEALNASQHILVEAGTGVGKSLAYLIPAVHFATQNGERVVISTNTINLQDQLYGKDIPDLQRILSFEFKAALLKGRSNYVCLRRLAASRHRGPSSSEEMRLLAKILVWLPSTVTGDQAELFLPDYKEQALWSRICADAETCLTDRCRYRQEGRCFFYRARREAERAHLIVVNHALLLSDVAVENRVLPNYRYLIVDEAHHLEASSTRQLSFAVDRGQMERLLNGLSQNPSGRASEPALNRVKGRSLGKKHPVGFLAELLARYHGKVPEATEEKMERHINSLHEQVEAAQRLLYQFFNKLDSFLEEHGQSEGPYNQVIRLTGGIRVQPAWANVEIAWDNLARHLLSIGQGLERLSSGLLGLDSYNIPDQEDLLQELLSFTSRTRELYEQMNALIAQPSSAGIYWAEVSAQDGEISLHAAPLHVGSLVQKHLFMPKECVVLTSATLCTEGEFDFIRERLSAWEADEAAVGSPFDYANSTLLYLPTDIPEPYQSYYQKTVEAALIDLCRATRGRTLVLFTSYSQLRNTSKAIALPLAEEEIVVYTQGSGASRAQLLENFRTTPRSVLLGTRSFWEGIDVVGEALSCLVIARLPFSVPSDPVFAARSETFDEPFSQYALPEAILRLRQGFGRLIRSKTDRGVVVILDKRVQTKSYGRAFLDSLPACTVRRGPLAGLPSAAARWIDEKEAQQPSLF